MMKFVILAVVFVAAMARPQDAPAEEPKITIVSSASENDGKGNFKYSFENSDGAKSEVEGRTEAPLAGSTYPVQVIQGSYSWVAPDGKTYSLSYIADQNGFQPKADFLPTPPADPNAAAPAARR